MVPSIVIETVFLLYRENNLTNHFSQAEEEASNLSAPLNVLLKKGYVLQVVQILQGSTFAESTSCFLIFT